MAFRTSLKRTVCDERELPSGTPLPDLKMIYPEYRIHSKIGKGGHAAVFEVVDRDYRIFALKVQEVSTIGPPKLQKEFDIYNTLCMNAKSKNRLPGIPWVYDYKQYEGIEYMVMERLGDSLDKIAERYPGKKLSKVDILFVGIQAIRRLRDLHENGILHRDVKPENLVMGNRRSNQQIVHIIDFGLATVVRDWSSYDCEQHVGFAGTEYFASAEAFFQKAPTRKGDLESLAYSLLCLSYGNLPWLQRNPISGIRYDYYELGMQRLRYRRFLCQDFPELTAFFEEVSNTPRAEQPNYERLINLLETAVYRIDNRHDGRFEWLM